MNPAALASAETRLCEKLLARRGPGPGWAGHLSSSALATAVAGFALSLRGESAAAPAAKTDASQRAAARARRWLSEHQNADGGWGDTTGSPANPSTTVLSLAALLPSGEFPDTLERARHWIAADAGGSDPATIRRRILAIYAEDKTFSAPILALCCAAGLFADEPAAGWGAVPQLPFELSLAPAALLPLLQLRVVSYALPALIAIGLARHRQAGRPGRPLHWLRERVTPQALRILERIQPASGGFLEAAPLTGFVLLSLVRSGLADHPVARRCAAFLRETQRPDGSWPIDTDLSRWVSSLAIEALPEEALAPLREPLLAELLRRQYRRTHPYTRSPAGGWAWTDRSGGVPDGDDTAAALKALHRLAPRDPGALEAAQAGLAWLLKLQNRDGGVPTFCRGWGKLPFDASCPDITAHACQAWARWAPHVPPALRRRLARARARARRFLLRSQRGNGTWIPLWFGNQYAPDQENPVFGTAQVLRAFADEHSGDFARALERGRAYLLGAQAADGSWGGDAGVPASLEETALATSALLAHESSRAAALRGAAWLAKRIEAEATPPAAPIGLYFASLWYDEALYPYVFTLDALRRARRYA